MDIGSRNHIHEPIPVGEAWPEHAGHEIIYSEHGRTDYILKTVAMTDIDGVADHWSVEEYDNRPTGGEISDTEVWCRTCDGEIWLGAGDHA